MRRVVGALAALHLACLDAPPASLDPAGPDAAAAGDGAPAIDAATCAGPWGPPAPVAEFAGVPVHAPTVSGDGALMIYDAGVDLAVATRAGDTFVRGPDRIVTALNSAGGENGPTLSADGLTLWFLRDSLLRVATREAGGDFTEDRAVVGFEDLEIVGPEVAETDDGLEIYFSLADAAQDTIYRAACDEVASCQPYAAVTELDESGQERFPTLGRDGREIVFRSSAVPGLVSYRRPVVGQAFDARADLAVDGFHPELAFDDTTLLFIVGADELYVMSRECP